MEQQPPKQCRELEPQEYVYKKILSVVKDYRLIPYVYYSLGTVSRYFLFRRNEGAGSETYNGFFGLCMLSRNSISEYIKQVSVLIEEGTILFSSSISSSLLTKLQSYKDSTPDEQDKILDFVCGVLQKYEGDELAICLMVCCILDTMDVGYQDRPLNATDTLDGLDPFKLSEEQIEKNLSTILTQYDSSIPFNYTTLKEWCSQDLFLSK